MVTVTLNKLNKLIARLKKLVKARKNLLGFDGYTDMNIVKVTYTCQSAENISKTLNEAVTDTKRQYQDYLVLSKDLIVMRSVLFTENIKNGIDEIMHKIELQKNIREMWVKCQTSSKNRYTTGKYIADEDMEKYVANNLTSISSNTDSTLLREAYTTQEIKTFIEDCDNTIYSLEDERDVLNRSRKATVTLDPITAKLIGL